MSHENEPLGTVLIVDDSNLNRIMLREMLEDAYSIIEAANGREALVALGSRNVSIVLLDLMMPDMDGYGVLRAMNDRGLINDTPVIVISTLTEPDAVNRAYDLGATDFINRPFNRTSVRHRVRNTVQLYAKQHALEAEVERQVRRAQFNSNMLIEILGNVVEFRNGESGLHIQHVRRITRLMLSWLNDNAGLDLSADEVEIIAAAAALHDLGKMAIDEAILNKPGRLTADEFAAMKEHSAKGDEMLSGIPAYQGQPLMKYAHQICRWHHERYDGKGYPDGLSGEDIPVAAQVVALADVYDALTSPRCYKPALPHEKAVAMILNGECGEFSPLLRRCLTEMSGTLKDVKAPVATGGDSP